LRREEQERSLISEYQSESERSSILPNKQNNQSLSNLNNYPSNNITFNANAAQTLILVLTNLNVTLVGESRENKSVNYPTFSEKEDEDINDFITELEKAFAVNRVTDVRKHLVMISCLKGIATNFYNRLVGITNWNTAE